MEKKPYTPPALTEHGDAVKETKGFGGEIWEYMNPKPGSDIKVDW
jgi:hypothetical protein